MTDDVELNLSNQVSEPFLVNELEYVSVSFLGQSFMLHQIVRPFLFIPSHTCFAIIIREEISY